MADKSRAPMPWRTRAAALASCVAVDAGGAMTRVLFASPCAKEDWDDAESPSTVALLELE
ncbi:MAG: hypothetical protein K0U52_07900 [Gammaproteobacteria bacterium]|nr:hypothetical protein [Gammaproteobacteria bacterium]